MTPGRLLALLLLGACGVWAQDWGRVRALAVGTVAEVQGEDFKVFRGTVARVTENRLELSSGNGRLRVGRSTVRRVRAQGMTGWRGRWLGWLPLGWKTVYERPVTPVKGGR